MVKHFLSSADFDKEQYLELLRIATESKQKVHNNLILNNKVAGIYTNKPSLRTRISFEVGIKELGGSSIFIKNDEISLGEREDYQDVARVLSRYLDLFIVRSHDQAGLETLAKYSDIPIINALTNKEHPCQALADVLTLTQYFTDIKGLKLTYIGDGNNVTHSLAIISAILGIELTIITPPEHEIHNDYLDLSMQLATKYNHPMPVCCNDPVVAQYADVVYGDVWSSMGDDSGDQDKVNNKFQPYQINAELLGNKNIKVLHCLPAHKGEEITEEIFEQNANIIFDQAENRLHAQKAIMQMLLS